MATNSVGIQNGFSFHAALQARFIRRLDIVNRGFSGYNTKNVVQYLPQLFQASSETVPKIEYLVVLLGANDSVKPFPRWKQHVPLEEYKANMKKIVTSPAIQAHRPKIILVTPPPVDEIRLEECDKANGWPEVTRRAAFTLQYVQAVRDLAAETPDAVIVDLWQGLVDYAISHTPEYVAGGPCPGTFEFGSRGGMEHLLPDGLHLSSQAYKVFLDLLMPHIGVEWANLPDDDRTGYQLPDWRDFQDSS